MSFPRYPAYKEGEDPMIGLVPEHWKKAALKHLADYQNGYPFKPDDWGDTGRPIIRIAQLTGDAEPDRYVGLVDERVAVYEGDLLFSWSATLDSFFWRGEPAWLNQHIFKVTPSKQCIKEYLYYLIKFWAPKLADVDAHGSTMRHIKKESLGQRLFVPPLDEQRSISEFLDHETAKIDALVAEQERLIELLKEKRQAVISHAVTKGLDPSVPMKNSGVEWLGEVPAHWALRPLKSLAKFRSGGTPDKRTTEYWDGDIPWASAKDLKVDQLLDTIDHITQFALDDGAAALIPAEAVVVVVRGMILARYFPVTTLKRPMAINQDLKALLPSSEVDAGYLAWLLRASEPETLNCLDEAGHGTKALRMENWGGMTVPVPPRQEQAAISAALEAATGQLDSSFAELEQAISLLQERRTALISAAVTGQIDVRGWTPPTDAP